MKKKNHRKRDLIQDEYPEAHTIDGKKMPPDGTAQPTPINHEGASVPWMKEKAIGVSYPEGQDFGPICHMLGEGMFHKFKIDFSEHEIPYSTGGVHPITGIGLLWYVSNVRPDVVIETGTFYGYSTMFLSMACSLWGQGTVYTIDPDQDMVSDYIDTLPNVCRIPGRSEHVLPELLRQVEQVDFAFLDSWKRLAFHEFYLIHPFLVEGGIVVFHDTQLLNTGRTLYAMIEEHFSGEYDTMLFSGIPHEENPHRFHGNADDRGLYVLRKKNENPFLDVADANTHLFGDEMVIAQDGGFHPVRIIKEGT